MMNIKSIILLHIFLFVITTSSPIYNYHTSINEDNDLKLTKELTEFLELVIQRFEKTMKLDVKKPRENISNYSKNNDLKDSIEEIEESGYFGGDMVLTENQADEIFEQVSQAANNNNVSISDLSYVTKRKRRKRKIKNDTSLKWDTSIAYYVDTGVNSSLVDEALRLIQKETCIEFVKISQSYKLREGLKFYSGKGCHSHVGKISQYAAQEVSIGPKCHTIGTIQHETMHALGCEHEQSRADRDDYLKLFMENVKKGHEHNFLKIDLKTFLTYETKYDYGSNMQYHSKAFSEAKNFTMLPTLPFYANTLGMDEGMSFLDTKLLNLHYCNDLCLNSLKCRRGGYQDPNNCKVCKCIEGFEGPTCNELPKPKPECGNVVRYNITNEMTKIKVVGNYSCIYHLKAPKGSKIKIKILFSAYLPKKRNTCQKQNSLEIKYLRDKTQTGAFFCDTQEGLTLETKDHYVLLYHRSNKQYNGVELTAKILTPK
ncbi:Astacin-like metalloendopeptidase [Strongyloides ratti]|uniref:Zinc metalloproteinase n=1 Tax=Strongyloides ratti TaxID=34506 RepID=A0A090LUN3_STRRB|nr:Astacin-like metalloendopeptidase [Strongyloides ratti]CEF71334.1 Astacin-like metalloendopeptidase [Strongyloides ratti]